MLNYIVYSCCPYGVGHGYSINRTSCSVTNAPAETGLLRNMYRLTVTLKEFPDHHGHSCYERDGIIRDSCIDL